jgi:hypothetical protein
MTNEFKRNEIRQELRGEPKNNFAVAIDGKTWKVFGSKMTADKVAATLRWKGKTASVYMTGAAVSI